MAHSPVERHQTAIRRTEYSRPIRIALESGLISESVAVFDYGCGQGDDLRRLKKDGIAASGWDPHFLPDAPHQQAPIVNLGFVLNVIEDPEERIQVLRRAWELTQGVLLVSTRPTAEERSEAGRRYSDGILTSRKTFQKFYEQLELRNWVELHLGQRAISAEPGIVFVFKDEGRRHAFVSRRLRHGARSHVRIRKADRLYEKHRHAFDKLLEFYKERGRTPHAAEFGDPEFLEDIGSHRRAIQVLRSLVGKDELAQLKQSVAEDLLVYLALDRFGGRPRFGQLPEEMQLDIRAHFGSYKAACAEADRWLFQAGNPMLIDAECRDSLVGKLTPTALYIHHSVLPNLSPVLKVYEGCARALLGEVPEANIIKLTRREAKISYLSYPRFDTDPHPALEESYSVNLKSLKASYYSYRDSANPPILHRKETFVGTDYPRRGMFERLTDQETRWGLLAQTAHIGTRDGWNGVLAEAGVALKGHRLVRR